MTTTTQEFQTIEIKDGDSVYPVKILNVNTATAWPKASEIERIMDINTFDSGKKVRLKMRGISLSQWTAVEEKNPILDHDEQIDSKKTELYEQLEKEAIALKRMELFEIATGKKIPGATKQEKINWLESKPAADMDAIFIFIRLKLCNFRPEFGSADEEMLDAYERYLQGNSEIVEPDSADDIFSALSSDFCFRFQRPGDDYITQFKMRHISSQDFREIELETKTPEAPIVPFRDALTGSLVPGKTSRNTKDPAYLAKLAAVAKLKTLRILQKCLMFEIPGTSDQERIAWIGERLIGDVLRIKRYIEEEVMGVASRYNFF